MAASLLLILSSCAEGWTPVETEPGLSASSEKVDVPADNEDETQVTDTVTISSNASWTARIEPEDCSWVTIETQGDLNVSGLTRNVPVVLKFADNKVKQAREASLIINSPTGETVIPVRQGEIVYRLKPTCDQVYPFVDYLGGKFIITFNCNTDWNVKLNDGNTAPARIDTLKGSGKGKIAVVFDENAAYDDRSFGFTVSAQECQDLNFSFTQISTRPYVLIDKAASDSTVIQSIGAWRNLVFRANVPWTATAEGDVTIDSYEESGDAGEVSFRVHIDGNDDFYNRKTAKIILTPEGGEPSEMIYEIEKASIMTLRFRLYPDEYSKDQSHRNWPFAETLVNNADDQEFHTAFGGYRFFFHTGVEGGSLAYNEVGFLFGYNASGGYIDLPGIEGKKLVRVELFVGNMTTNQIVSVAIVNPDGNKALDGGDFFKFGVNSISARYNGPTSVEHEMAHDPQCYGDWKLNGTEKGKSYRLYFASNRIMARWLTLTYED